MAKIEEKVESLVKDKIEKIGYELYDVIYTKEGSNKILRIVIDSRKRNIIRRLWKSQQRNKRNNRRSKSNRRTILFRNIITRNRKTTKKRLATKKIQRWRSKHQTIQKRWKWQKRIHWNFRRYNRKHIRCWSRR